VSYLLTEIKKKAKFISLQNVYLQIIELLYWGTSSFNAFCEILFFYFVNTFNISRFLILPVYIFFCTRMPNHIDCAMVCT